MSGKPVQKALLATLIMGSGVSPVVTPIHAAPSVALVKEASGEVDLVAAKALFDKHSACFVDARGEFAYYNSHIKGALSLSDSRFDEQFPDFKMKTGIETAFVVYCSGPNCGKARHVADKLRKNGYRNVRVYPGGMTEWTRAGFPIEAERD
ncbi:MAG: rhodanese-like domain-containing protein [Chlorobiaceae bacterium]|nr:rhodanese-like domain-containing protein [Chlorobiaceae bacterium]